MLLILTVGLLIECHHKWYIERSTKVDGSTLYDALYLSFNMVDKTNILKLIRLI